MRNYKRKLIWFSEIRWDYLITRKQQLLKRFPRDWKILFIEPIVIGKKPNIIPRVSDNIYIVTIPYLRGSSNKFFSKILATKIIKAFIKIFGELIALFWISKLGFSGRNRIIALSSIHWGDFASKLSARVKFYDCNDDHLKFAEDCPWAIEYIKKYLEACDFMTYVSDELDEKIQNICKVKSYFIGNGVDFVYFNKRKELPDEIRNLNKPIIGYSGTIDYIDRSLLIELSKNFVECSIVLIGPEFKGSHINSFIEKMDLKNVYYLGKVDYKLLPGYIQAFDVAIIPFKKDEISKSLNPNKLYEYLASGLNIVTMDFSKKIRELKGIIHVAKTKNEFIELTSLALKKRKRNELGIEIAIKNDWSIKAKQLIELIEGYYNSEDN